jgi:hypothetical protein
VASLPGLPRHPDDENDPYLFRVDLFGPVWLLGAAQRHLDRPLRWVSPAAARGAYGAFLPQGPVPIGLALAVRPVPVPAEVKAFIVAAAGVAASFAIASLVIRRSPRLARIL